MYAGQVNFRLVLGHPNNTRCDLSKLMLKMPNAFVAFKYDYTSEFLLFLNFIRLV